MILSNYHTHTVYCDGKDTAEDMIRAAVAMGCREIGFTGHAYTPCGEDYCMSREGQRRYREELLSLRERYKDKIKVLVGIEMDYFSEPIAEEYDYIIGSVHHIEKDGVFLDIDLSPEGMKEAIDRHFGGDGTAFAEAYYALLSEIYEKTHCDIVGHFDLVTKFEECGVSVGSDTERYRKAASRALDALLLTPCLFEINTGAISRGYRTSSYPAPEFRRRIAESGKPFLINSDAHAAENILYGIEKEAADCDRMGYPYLTSLADYLGK